MNTYPYPMGPSFESKRRRAFVTYHIVSRMFKESASSTLFMFTTGRISYTSGTNSFTVSREQANFILRQSRDEKFQCTVTRRVDNVD